MQGDASLMGPAQGLGWWEQGMNVGPREEATAGSKPEMLGADGKDADKQLGLKRVWGAHLRSPSSPAGHGVREKTRY